MIFDPTPVEYDAASGTWLLRTPGTAYAIRVVDDSLWHVYWGPPLTLEQVAGLPLRPAGVADILGEELPGEGGERFGPASVQVAFADGTRSVEWRLAGHEVDEGHLTVRLADRHYPLELELHYRVHPNSDVTERWSALRNTADQALRNTADQAGAVDQADAAKQADAADQGGIGGDVLIDRLDAASWTVPPRTDYRLSHVVGEWAAEFQLRRSLLAYGETVLTSRRGITRNQGNPWLMVDPGDSTETHGEVFSAALAWSGTWRITARRATGHLSLSGGSGHEGTGWRLRPGERWQSPVFAGLFTDGGFGAASRAWHDYARRHVLPTPAEPRPVLYNSWEGTWFDVNETNQRELAAVAAELGVELFVMDDGWFGRRASDNAALGDWWPNPEKFPNGLNPLITEVHRLGMRFGLWVEPEMVNPDSDLYRERPDWVLHMPHRRRTEVRNQLVLNFARADVVEWAFGWLDRLLTEHEIDFLKWDMNRSFTEAGWPEAGGDASRLWVEHTRNVYALIDRLRAAHPGLRIETCASGGGRVDHGILSRTDQAWVSDNTDPVDRIAIQHGYGQVYPPETMGAWASDSPNPITRRLASVRFRMHVAMAGALGISGNLREWSKQEREEAAEWIARYKEIRPIVQHGSLFRLTEPPAGRIEPEVNQTTAVQYVSQDGGETVVLVWCPQPRFGDPRPPLRLGGLDASGRYRDVETGAVHDGAVLGQVGLRVELPPGDNVSALVHLRRLT